MKKDIHPKYDEATISCACGHVLKTRSTINRKVRKYAEHSGGALSWRAAPWTPVKGRTVLLLDDILDEGVTLAAIAERMMQLGAKACYTAVATDKQNGKVKPIKADFVALPVPDRFVFGYGMDVRGQWRNLPAIYAIKED